MVDVRVACERFAARLVDDQTKGGCWLRALERDNQRVRAEVHRWRRPDGHVPYEGLLAVAAIYVRRSAAKIEAQEEAARPTAEIVPHIRRGPRNFLKMVDHG